jgi:PAS domain S-box-containing protein
MTLRREFNEVQKLIVKFSRGEFSGLPSAPQKTEVLTAFIENLVMLGEELNETTVSKEYFQDIFNSVPDFIIITDGRGKILTCNQVMEKFKQTIGSNSKGPDLFNDIFTTLSSSKKAFGYLKERVLSTSSDVNTKLQLVTDSSRIFKCNFGRLKSEQKATKYLALINEITETELFQEQLIESVHKYRQLFSYSSDGIFIVDKGGKVVEKNQALTDLLKLKITDKHPGQLAEFIEPLDMSITEFSKKMFEGSQMDNIEVKIKAKDKTVVDCLFSSTPLYEKKRLTGFQGLLKNISQYKEYNSLLMRSLGESQERERKRIATDLHDSIGQQLSGIKFMLNSLIGICHDNESKELLLQMNADIYNIIEEIRKICFDLMPGALEEFGLIKTVEEFLSKCRKMSPGVSFIFQPSKNFPRLRRELEVGLYRIMQEFVNNSLKYSRCSKIIIILSSQKRKMIDLVLKDNGKGIPPSLLKSSKGMGLNNIYSRVRSFNGTISTSTGKQGTIFNLKIPATNYDYN